MNFQTLFKFRVRDAAPAAEIAAEITRSPQPRLVHRHRVILVVENC